ncbi:hypothetical protein H8A97_39025 [Bradyrhizobium sp. Arg62]|uniref:hypothetical protein n=1 Tax=Bradyrhizobium brasilense TaxID=1419277 RepID=UPI001E4FCDFD|nr:hypothetical protein [Bradyrhizobium brasilense]MCC8950898.1 hypothetical protein [Bradyrhizobium brasilense]
MSEHHLPQQSLLDWLRPDTGFQTDIALVSTYSASAGVLASLLLSLAGFEDDPSDSGSRATRVKFAKSILQLKDRVAITMQAGRLFWPRKSGKATALLDRFIKDMRYDERAKGGKSWHPKCAIVRYSSAKSSAAKWRLWLGSRNLTRDTSWDLGLSLEGYEFESDAMNGMKIPSVANVTRKLAAEADQAERWREPIKRLRNVHWEVPRGLVVEEIDLMLPQDASRDFPPSPEGVRRLIAVAPFLDATIPKRVGKWGDDAERILVSTGTELNRFAKGKADHFENAGFSVVGDFPAVAEEGEQDVAGIDEAGIDPQASSGLHAKFLWVEHAKGATMWLGSPNLTGRAWTRNAEIFARLSIESRGAAKAAAAIKQGVESFVSMAPDFAALPAKDNADADDPLELARNEVAARLMNASQKLSSDWSSVEIQATELPHPANKRIVLKVGSLADDPGQMIEWQRGSRNVRLRPHNPQAASHLIRVALECRGLPSVAWLQSIPIQGFQQDKRDRLLLRQYLSDDQLLAWIHQTLTGNSEGAEGGPWDEDGPHPAAKWRGPKRKAPAPTLEDMLRAWLKNRSAFDQIDEIIEIFESGGGPAGTGSQIVSFKAALALIKRTFNEPAVQ